MRNPGIGDTRRLLWIVNHQTLLRSEVPLLRELGFGVLSPSASPPFRTIAAALLTFRPDASLQLPAYALKVLNTHEFYEDPWGATLETILNRYFDGLITTLTAFTTPLFEAIRKFDGLIVERVFGREVPQSYSAFFAGKEGTEVLDRIEAMGQRFVFGQG